MFLITAIFEDLQFSARSNSGIGKYHCIISDAYTGETKTIELEPKHIQMILAFNLDKNGEPEGFKQYYAELEPIFKDWPNNLRPIP
jgi:hypothetical protein